MGFLKTVTEDDAAGVFAVVLTCIMLVIIAVVLVLG
jgi:hypothetical protein